MLSGCCFGLKTLFLTFFSPLFKQKNKEKLAVLATTKFEEKEAHLRNSFDSNNSFANFKLSGHQVTNH